MQPETTRRPRPLVARPALAPGLALALALALAWPHAAAAFEWDDFGVPDTPDFEGLCERPPTVSVDDPCPTEPTLAHCSDPVFLASDCGRPYATGADPRCAELLNGRSSLCLEGRPLVPMMSWDTAADVDGVLDRFDDDAVTYAGMDGTYAGEVTGARARRSDADGAGLGDALVRDWWARNCSVQSCDEYVYEKYYDLAAFERYAGTLGDDWRAIFEAIYAAGGIAGRHIRGYAGSSVGWIEPTGTRTRQNAFFSYRPWEDPIDWFAVAGAGGFPDVYGFDALGGVEAFFSGCALDPVSDTVACDDTAHPAAAQAATAMNEAIGHYDAGYHPQVEPASAGPFPPAGADPWAWHRSMSDALADVADERLLWLAELQDEFATLRDAQARVRAKIRREVDAITLIDAVPDDVAARLNRPGHVRALRAAIDRQRTLAARLDELLAVAAANGCLDRDTVTPCDWSPQWLAEDVFGLLDDRRAADYQRCLAFTGGDFGRLWDEDPADGEPQWLVAWAAERGDFCVREGERVPGCAIRDSYIRDERTVDLYFTTVAAWFDSLAFPVDPETGAPIVGESAADEGRQGDALFDVDYDFDVGWRLSRVTAADPCDLGVAAGAGAHVTATAFGVTGELLGATVTAALNEDAADPGGAVGLGITVLGVDLYTEAGIPATTLGGERYAFNVVEEPSLGDGVSTQKTFYVGWVPFTFQAGMSGTVGVRIGVAAEASLCDPDDIDAQFAFTTAPFANVRAYASGALGVPGVSLGVRTDLTLVDLRVPFTADLALSLAADRFTSEARIDVEMELLRGSVSLVAELLVKTWRRRLFGWPGVEWGTTPLANGFDFDLGLVRAAAGADGAPTVEGGRLYADVGDDCLLPRELPAPDWYVDFNDANVSGASVSPSIGAAPLALEGDATAGRVGVWGQAVRVGGAGGVVSAAPAPPVGGPASLSLWVRPEGLADAMLVSRGDAAGATLALESRADGALYLTARCGGGLRGRRALGALRDERWNHLVLTWQPDGGHLAVWLNGVEAVAIDGCALDGPLDGLALGRSTATATPRPFTGRVDEVALWADTALARSDVYELFDRGLGGRPVFGDGAAVPQGVADLAATSGDGTIRLSWTNPPSLADPNEGYSAVEIRHAPGHAPRTVTEGERLVLSSVQTGAVHQGLAVGDVVHYSAFLHRDGAPAVRGPSVVGAVTFSLPGPVTGVTAQAGAGRVDLSWTNPADPSFWRVRVMRGVDDTPPDSIHLGVLVCEGRVTSCADTGLEPGRTYTYAIFTLADGYQHGAPTVATATTIDTDVQAPDVTPPGPIEGLAITTGDGTVTLRWTPPPAADFDHVRVQRAAETGFAIETLPDRPTTRLDDAGLQNGVRYFYALAAVDEAGNVGPAVTATATPSVAGHGGPADFAATGTGDGVALSWTPPAADGVHIVRSRLRPLSDWRSGTLVHAGDGADGGFLDADVAAGETWYYAAFTVVGGAYYGPSHASAARLDPRPGPVTDLTARAGEREATLSWTLPADGDLDRVELRLSSEATPGAAEGTLAYAGLGTSATVTGLQPDTQYFVAAYVYDRAGQRSDAAVQAFRTAAIDVPPAPVSDLVVVPATDGATLTWTNPPDADLARIDVRYSSQEPPTAATGVLAATGLLSELALTGLASERTYYVAIFAVDDAGLVSDATRATFTTLPPPDHPPGPVTDLVVEAGEQEATARWTLPTDDDLDRVELRLSPDAPPGPAEGALVYEGAGTTATFGDLAFPATYHLAAYAWDAGGNVSEAATATFTTVDLPPPPVTDIDFYVAADFAEFYWTNPAVPDFASVEVRQSTVAPPGPDDGIVVFSGSVSGILLSDLTPETTYHHTVFAFDDAGNRSEGASATFTTLPPDDLPPGPVTDLAATPTDTTATLTWTLPADDDLDRVEVRLGATVVPPPTGGVLAYAGLDTTTTLTGLTPETDYFVGVYTYDQAGQFTAEPTSVAFTTLPSTPPPPIEVVEPDPRPVFAGETVQVRAAYTVAPDVTRPDTFVWRSVGAVPVGIDAPVDPFDAFLTFPEAGTAQVELTVSNGVDSDSGVLTFEVAAWDGPANDIADHPFAAPVAAPPAAGIVADDVHVYTLDGVGDPAARTLRVFDGATRAELGAVAIDGVELVGVGSGRVYALDQTRRTLQVVDVSDPAQPTLLTPWDIGTSGANGWAVAGDTVVAIHDFGAAVLQLAKTADGLAEVGSVTLPAGRRTTDIDLGHGGAVLYVTLQPEPMEAPALWAYDLQAAGGPAPVAWLDLGEASETGGESVTGLAVRGDRLVTALDPDFESRRFVLVDTSAPDALTLVRAPAERFGYAQRLQLAGETVFCLELDPRDVVATIDLAGAPAALGDFFPGPGPGAGAFALYPAAAPTEIWVAARPTPTDRGGEAGVHVFALDAPRASSDTTLPASARGAVGGDERVLIVAGDDALRFHDPNASPFTLPLTGTLPHAVYAGGGVDTLEAMALRGDVLYVVEPGPTTGDVLRTIDVSDFAAPVELDRIELGSYWCRDLFPLAADGATGGRVVVGCETYGWTIVDASDPAALALEGGQTTMWLTGHVEPTTGQGTAFTDMGALVRRDFTAADPFAAATTIETGLYDTYLYQGAPLWTRGDHVWLSSGDAAERWDVADPAAPAVGALVPQGSAKALAWRFVPDHAAWLTWGPGGVEVNRLVDGAPTSARTAHFWPAAPATVDLVGALSVHASRVGVPDAGGRALLWRPVGAYRPLNEYATGRPGETLVYTYTASTVFGTSETCVVTGGTCAVTSGGGGLATVEWTLPATPGLHELSFVAGDPTFFVTVSDRLRVE